MILRMYALRTRFPWSSRSTVERGGGHPACGYHGAIEWDRGRSGGQPMGDRICETTAVFESIDSEHCRREKLWTASISAATAAGDPGLLRCPIRTTDCIDYGWLSKDGRPCCLTRSFEELACSIRMRRRRRMIQAIDDRRFDQRRGNGASARAGEFWQPGCGGCRALLIELEKLAAEMWRALAHSENERPRELSDSRRARNRRSLPALALYRNGRLIGSSEASDRKPLFCSKFFRARSVLVVPVHCCTPHTCG